MEQTSNRFALWISIGRITSMLVVFAMPLILTRYLSKADYGIFSQFFTLYSALYIIFGFGLTSNLFYYYPTANKDDKEKFISNSFFLMFLMGLVALIVLLLPFVQDSLFSDGELKEYKYFIIACVAMAIPMNIIAPIYTVRKDKLGALILPALVAVLRVGVIILCAIFFSNLYNVFTGLLVYQVCIFFLSYIYALKFKMIKINKTILKKQLVYSLPVGLTVVLLQLSQYFDKIICISNIDSETYAVYSVAFLSIPFINQIYDSLCQVNVINMTTCYQNNDMSKVVKLYNDFVAKTLSFSTPIIFVVSLFAEEVISFLYPSNYAAAAPYFRVYTITFLFAMFGAGTVLRATGMTRFSTLSYIMGLFVSFPLTYYLIKQYGINGAIIGAVLNQILPRSIQMMFEVKVLSSSFQEFFPWKKILEIAIISLTLILPLLFLKLKSVLSIVHVICLSGGYIILCYYVMVSKNIFIVDKRSLTNFTAKIKNTFSK